MTALSANTMADALLDQMSGMSRRNPLPAGPAISREEGTPIVALRDLRLTIPTSTGAVAILQGLDLDIAAGESVGVLGPSGSGKTSLLMVIAGLERGSGGSIRVAGQALEALDEEARALFRLRNLGIVFQSFHLIPTMGGGECRCAARTRGAGGCRTGRGWGAGTGRIGSSLTS